MPSADRHVHAPAERSCHAHIVVALLLMSSAVACGGRTSIFGAGDHGVQAREERCNGRDDDGDTRVDEGYRDSLARYVTDAHCGACGHDCVDVPANARAVGCGLIAEVPLCVATACEPGFGVSRSGACVAIAERVCMPCQGDDDCGSLPSARCTQVAGAQRCVVGCEDGCPEGFACDGELCLPEAGDCTCDEGEHYTMACAADSGGSMRCAGRQVCDDGVLSSCELDVELCDGQDNDCDGAVDEDFVDALSAYSLDLRHCGRCGVDCTRDDNAGVPLTCGGDPFAPSCVVSCPDALDGVHVGDRIDADRQIENGCECIVQSLTDSTGQPMGETQLDANCDGADGSVLSSFYVATDGDDLGPGSPTRPLRTISRAIELAHASHASMLPRPHVYVASGTYVESLRLLDGVRVHGGYRRDFLARNPDGLPVVVVAPADTRAYFGAALVAEGLGARETVLEGMELRGFDAQLPGQPAVGAYVAATTGLALVLQDLVIRSGRPGAGQAGSEGTPGQAPSRSASSGAPPRAALEDLAHECVVSGANRTAGGVSGRNVCDGVEVSGGLGGGASCPDFGSGRTPSGETGAGSLAGLGGLGGTDVRGPIFGGGSCPSGLCCGLADFSVPGTYPQSTPGADGGFGSAGVAGAACSDSLGAFLGVQWSPGAAFDGLSGKPGSGGGGGGSGGGAQMIWTADGCEFADGLGGAGGGGGAGGCGGSGGRAGAAGGPSVGVLVLLQDGVLPSLRDLRVIASDGGRGGDGGAGGDGGRGGQGGQGGKLSLEQLSTPTLAGAAPGERGGNGGDGGGGGGGGGGCGGASVGVWVEGAGNDAALAALLAKNNDVIVGRGGTSGRGGGGAMPAAAGAQGAEIDVLVR